MKSAFSTCAIIFSVFFMISLGLGYATLNRFDPVAIEGLRDIAFYADVVRNGPVFQDEQTAGIQRRILMPAIGHLVYVMLPHLGSWNAISVALLLVNSAFTALSVVLIFDMTYRFYTDVSIALVAGFLFVTSFFVTNSYLVGSVDAAYGFFFLVLYSSLLREKWNHLPIIMCFGCLAKEVFLPVGGAFVLFALLHRVFTLRGIPWAQFVPVFLMLLSGGVTIVVTNYFILGSISPPWAMLPVVDSDVEQFGFDVGVFVESIALELLRFFLSLGLLVILGLCSMRSLPLWFLVGNSGAVFMVLSLGAYISLGGANVTGADYARFVFSPAALLLCSASAATLCGIKLKFGRHANDTST